MRNAVKTAVLVLIGVVLGGFGAYPLGYLDGARHGMLRNVAVMQAIIDEVMGYDPALRQRPPEVIDLRGQPRRPRAERERLREQTWERHAG